MMHVCLICGETREGTLPTFEENLSDEEDEMLQHEHIWIPEE